MCCLASTYTISHPVGKPFYLLLSDTDSCNQIPEDLSAQNEPFSTAERSERVENFHFRATREYTEAGIKEATVAMQCLGANSPEPRRRAVPG